jgi:hypothetical protein
MQENAMKESWIPYRCAIHWRMERNKDGLAMLVYGFHGLIRFNTTAALLWERIDGRHTVAELRVTLKESFPDLPDERLRQDVDAFLARAGEEGLILCPWSPLQPYHVHREGLVP